MRSIHRIPPAMRDFRLFFTASAIVSSFLLTNSNADPTLVVDIDTGNMEIHVGDTSGIAPLTKPILGCSWGGVGPCTAEITPGDWLSFTGFQITSGGDTFNADGNAVSSPGDVTGFSVLANTLGGYAEGSLFSANQFEPLVIPLSKTYDTSVDAQDIMFSSVMGLNTTQWNTIYISEVPEPTTLVLLCIGAIAGAVRRRR